MLPWVVTPIPFEGAANVGERGDEDVLKTKQME